MIDQQDIQKLIDAARLAGFVTVNKSDLKLEILPAGAETHRPHKLPLGYSAVYIFKYQEEYLKVGKANKNSKARFKSQHYHSGSSRSNLSLSLLKDESMNQIMGNTDPGAWIMENTTRFNILIPKDLGMNFVNFCEAFFILKCNPKYEG